MEKQFSLGRKETNTVGLDGSMDGPTQALPGPRSDLVGLLA
jgi:hypothetical protein